MSDIFISYSRRDAGVRARRCTIASPRRSGTVWVDWEDIPPSAEWLAEIERAIEASDTVVFVLSPDSVAVEDRAATSASMRRGWASGSIPVVTRDVDAATVPDVVARLNWLSFTSADAFDRAYACARLARSRPIWCGPARTRGSWCGRATGNRTARMPSYLIGGIGSRGVRAVADAGQRPDCPP